MPSELYLHQEVLLLSLCDARGTPLSSMHVYAVAGAVLSELLLQERIVVNDDKKKTVAIVDDEKTGDPVLDECLELIDDSKKHHGLQHWISKTATLKRIHHRVAESLCDKGILKADEKKVLFVFTRQVYPELNGTFEDNIRDRMARVMFDASVEPDERTAVLVALANHGGLLARNFAEVELRQHKQRIADLANGDLLAAGATRAAIEAVQAATSMAVVVATIS